MTILEAQSFVKNFSRQRNWEDYPNIDKFDHIHEELLEISQHLRYKTREEREKFVSENKEMLQKEVGDVLFAVLRLANQLGVDAEMGFLASRDMVRSKYGLDSVENNIVHPTSGDTQFGSPS